MHCASPAHPTLLGACLLQVFKLFKDIAAVSGEKSQDRKKAFIIKLIVAAKGQEAGYVMRALQVGWGGMARPLRPLHRACIVRAPREAIRQVLPILDAPEDGLSCALQGSDQTMPC